MQLRHSNPGLYFQEQSYTTEKYIVPFLKNEFAISEQTVVAEIGCGFGGNMLPFLEMGCTVYGIDISLRAIDIAGKSFAERSNTKQPHLMASDIFDIEPVSLPKFDLIIMRDVMEHLHNKEKFINHIANFIKPGGKLFIAFPPFMMPFAGHQQMCVSKLASKLPYYHLLPRSVYATVLRMFGESNAKIDGLLEIKDTRLHLWKFHRMIKKSQFSIVKEENYMINPNYEIKFGLKPRKLPLVMNIPVVREFFITTSYILLQKNTH